MNTLSSILTNPTTLVMAEMYIAFQIASAFVQSLPTPAEWPQGGIWYKAFSNFLNILIADFKSFLASKGTTTATVTQSTTTESTPSGNSTKTEVTATESGTSAPGAKGV
jgi:hypothetical protein